MTPTGRRARARKPSELRSTSISLHFARVNHAETPKLAGGAVEVEAIESLGPGADGAEGGGGAIRRVRAVIPCFNRRRDAELLLGDLAMLDLRAPGGPIALSAVLVDNASAEPLSTVAVPSGVDLTHLRLDANTGGSGGFNAGMAHVLAGGIGAGQPPDYVWLLDSDVRLHPAALTELVRVLDERADLAAAGSALVDPVGGSVFEIGGRVNRRSGRFEPALTSTDAEGGTGPVRVDYVAACSALVRRTAIERTGLMPDVFLNADDVEWFVRMARRTGLGVAAAPASRATHPTFDRFQTWARYYVARNALGPVQALDLGPVVRFRRAMREVARALQQTVLGRDDLAALHLRGLADAAKGALCGAAPPGTLVFEPFAPFAALAASLEPGAREGAGRSLVIHPRVGLSPAALREVEHRLGLAGLVRAEAVDMARTLRPPSALRDAIGALGRFVVGPPADVAVIPARGRPDSWFLGRTLIEVVPDGFVVRRPERWRILAQAVGIAGRGLWLALRLMLRGPQRTDPALPPPISVPSAAPTPGAGGARDRAPGTLSIVVLSYNRAGALVETLAALSRHDTTRSGGAEVIVVDNASTDGSAALVREKFPTVQVIALQTNSAIAGFNTGVARATGDLVLVLDDDARPDPAALDRAIELLATRPDLAAVALHPRHPATGASEWPFADDPSLPAHLRDRWPVMGCGNLVRRSAWLGVGGYEESFFLYRNDVDLAMKLLGAGHGVHFNPAWVVWHDSPAAARKSARWFELATRNWIWTARRHGRGLGRVGGVLLGWAWAHGLAGARTGDHLRVLRGAARGLFERPPVLPGAVKPNGAAYAALLRLRTRRPRTSRASRPIRRSDIRSRSARGEP